MSHIPYLLPPLYNLIFASTLPSFVSSNHVLTCQSLSPDGGFHRLPQAYASQTFGSISYLHQIYGAGTAVFGLRRHIITTVQSSDSQEQAILVAQRKNRPVSPHLAIYKKQLTAVMSAFHRLSGVYLAFGFYGITCSFAAASILGVPIDPASIVSFFSSLPAFVDYSIKALIGFPFVYHFWNGMRHLVWDSGHETTLKGVYLTGYITIGLTALSGLWLLFC